MRYNLERRVVGTQAPDPDGAGALGYAAMRSTYDVYGNLIRVETGELVESQSASVAPSAWSGFSVHRQVDSLYDLAGRRLRDTLSAGP